MMVALTGASQAALIDLGNGTVKDDTTNLIWLQDWSASGFEDWDTQMLWADGLDFAGSTDWRLPSIGEYVALFLAYGDLTEVTAFSNVKDDDYWSGTAYALDPDDALGDAWLFYALDGSQDFAGKLSKVYAVAVRPGDLAASVPEPQALALSLLALGAMVVARRRRAH